ncbi:hypothetical protein H9L10_05180 [Phycicoccus endophyticus]|uniref:Nuclear transport factor 2 family protein n=1 Tax=Phycicoccus endophyticus TaxID=1690220 RepID=A0A7G9R484_9MICO|nr:hypothetical protein [Phycicoccus endophyticus]NHI18262.1 hypothetical protein [Phycicoccus endophyticus]QNN50409.1 hypothetical protein H9L10_05180 [Phycicoccus endophyticus]
MTTLGPRLARAIAAKDPAAVRALVTPDVDFRGLTPGRAWAGSSADELVDVLFGSWFEDADEVLALLDVTTGAPVEDTERVSYRLALHNGDGDHTAEQQVYYRTDGDRIVHLRVLCSGFRPARHTA